MESHLGRMRRFSRARLMIYRSLVQVSAIITLD